MKASGLMVAVFAAVVVAIASLALAGLAWAQAADEDRVQPQVVGGTGVANGKYPFMASLQMDLGLPPPSPPSGHYCGGTLIDRDSVLTAGHCVYFLGNTTDEDTPLFRRARIVVGTTVLKSDQGQKRRIARLSDIYMHPDLNLNSNTAYDVAVIELDRPVKGIRPIKLAPVGSDAFETPGRRATVVGWGSVLARPLEPPEGEDPELKFPNRMHEAKVPIVLDTECQETYAATGAPILEVFPELMVCAGAENLDTCTADSGGPMFVRADRRRGQIGHRQIGITGFGAGCGAPGFPGVYTEVNSPSIASFIRGAAGGA